MNISKDVYTTATANKSKSDIFTSFLTVFASVFKSFDNLYIKLAKSDFDIYAHEIANKKDVFIARCVVNKKNLRVCFNNNLTLCDNSGKFIETVCKDYELSHEKVFNERMTDKFLIDELNFQRCATIVNKMYEFIDNDIKTKQKLADEKKNAEKSANKQTSEKKSDNSKSTAKVVATTTTKASKKSAKKNA